MNPKLKDAIDTLLRKQPRNDPPQDDLIEKLWLIWARHARIPERHPQWIEGRRCFFAGAAMCFEAFTRILDPGDDLLAVYGPATGNDVRRLDALDTELQRAWTEILEGQ